MAGGGIALQVSRNIFESLQLFSDSYFSDEKQKTVVIEIKLTNLKYE